MPRQKFEIGDKVDYLDPKTGEPRPLGTICRSSDLEGRFFLPNGYKVKITHPQENENAVGEESFFWYGVDRLRLSEEKGVL